MKYQAVANSALYHCGYRWLVIDENWETVSEHVSQEAAEKEADRLNTEEDTPAPVYHKQSIELILDKNTDLYRRIEASAAKEGTTVESITNLIASVGIAHFMSDNLKFIYEREAIHE